MKTQMACRRVYLASIWHLLSEPVSASWSTMSLTSPRPVQSINTMPCDACCIRASPLNYAGHLHFWQTLISIIPPVHSDQPTRKINDLGCNSLLYDRVFFVSSPLGKGSKFLICQPPLQLFGLSSIPLLLLEQPLPFNHIAIASVSIPFPSFQGLFGPVSFYFVCFLSAHFLL